MINFIKKHWLLILLGMLATFLGAIWLLKPWIGQELIDESLPKLARTKIEGIDLNPTTRISFNLEISPKSLPVFNIKRPEPMSMAEMDHIARSLGFSDEPRVENDVVSGSIYIWNRNQYFLSIVPTTNNIELTSDIIPTETGSLLDPEEVRKTLFSLFDNLGFSFSQTQFTFQKRYLKPSGFEIAEVSPSRAQVLELSFNPVQNETPIVTNSTEDKMIVAEFDTAGKLLTLKIHAPVSSIENGQQYALKNLEDIKKSIFSEGKILQSEVVQHQKSISDVYIVSIQITQATLAYFMNPEESIVQPIYILRGNAQAVAQQQFPITIYLPAIKSGYFVTQQSR